MNLIPTNVHGFLDYVVGLLLIAAPWLFGFYAAGAESLVPIVIGIAIIGWGLFTNYELGAVRSIAMPTHLWLDAVAGFVLLVSPWLFGFAHIIVWPHVLVGLIVLIVAAVTARAPTEARSTARVEDPTR